MQCNLIQELMLYEFELGHKSQGSNENICCVKGTVDYNPVIRWWKKLDDQAKSGRPKTVDSEAVLRAREANPREY